MFDSCLQPMTEGPSNYFLSCSFLFVKLLLGYTSDLNLSADLQPVIAYIFKVFSSGKTERLFHPKRAAFFLFSIQPFIYSQFLRLSLCKKVDIVGVSDSLEIEVEPKQETGRQPKKERATYFHKNIFLFCFRWQILKHWTR